MRDHCHLTSTFRGTEHRECSLNYKVPKFVLVVFHNLAGYDSYLFVKCLGLPRATSTASLIRKSDTSPAPTACLSQSTRMTKGS